jgi:chemotaxis protein methyltransferase CheR|tara:strand:+ start:988 stop:2382 length:1395 start_codon:yes stop_codon:yes gene_type:complete
MNAFAPFKALVHERCGLHLEGLAEARLVRAIASLQSSTGLTDTTQLLHQLTSETVLFDHFVSQLTVNETYFYREPEALNWLANDYLPERLAAGNAPLSIFSAGCSSGEEPYSIAMMLYERFGERARSLVHLSGGDLDHQVLAKARQAIYGGMAFRALSPALKARYFKPVEGRYQLRESLRQWVNFRPFNLLNAKESPPDGPFDVILFRNVSIYFDEPTRRRIHQRLSQWLAPNGILLCGVTETLGNDLGIFKLTEAQGVFYFRRDEPSNTLPTSTVPATSLITEHSSDEQEPLASTAAFTKPTPLEQETDDQTDSMMQQLHTAHRLLNQNAFKEAATLLEALLTQQPWSLDALVLAGLVARWQHQPQLAHDHFKRAIYVAPECWPAHFYLAELYRQGELIDEPLQRQRRYASVVRLLLATPTSNGGLAIIAAPLPPGDARFLAERHLKAADVTLATTSSTQGVG